MTVMDRAGRVVQEGFGENRKEAVASFLAHANCDGTGAAVVEATQNGTVMDDWLEELVWGSPLVPP